MTSESKQPHVRVVTPAVKPKAARGAAPRQSGAAPQGAAGNDAFLRAENEDDDGYDPYSDRREEAPLFEAHPWD